MSRARGRARRNPWIELVRLAILLMLVSLPFAVFFLVINAAPWNTLWAYWEAALVFGMPIALVNWAVDHFVAPHLEARLSDDPRNAWWISGVHFVASIVASLGSVVLLSRTVAPGFIREGRSAAIALVISAVFATLFLGGALALKFYRRALEHAGSDRELALARRIQRSFLLTDFPRRARLDVHAVNRSSREVSGDFYDVVPAGPDGLVLAVVDVSGKGVPAALLSSMIQASLRTQAGTVPSPAAMTSAINTLACQRDSTGQFATLFLASVDEPTLTLRCTNAGHNPPVLVRADGTQQLLETGGLLAGMMPDATYEEQAVSLAPGDRLVVYTDGVTEAADAAGTMFGEERLHAVLRALPAAQDARADVEAVLAAVERFLGEVEPGDDITVLVMRVRETAGPSA